MVIDIVPTRGRFYPVWRARNNVSDGKFEAFGRLVAADSNILVKSPNLV